MSRRCRISESASNFTGEIIVCSARPLLLSDVDKNLNGILIKVTKFPFTKMHRKRYAKWWPFCSCFNLLTLAWETPEMYQQGYVIMMVADALAQYRRQTISNSHTDLQCNRVSFCHTNHMTHQRYRLTVIKQTISETSEAVGNPVVSLLLTGLSYHYHNTSWYYSQLSFPPIHTEAGIWCQAVDAGSVNTRIIHTIVR